MEVGKSMPMKRIQTFTTTTTKLTSGLCKPRPLTGCWFNDSYRQIFSDFVGCNFVIFLKIQEEINCPVSSIKTSTYDERCPNNHI